MPQPPDFIAAVVARLRSFDDGAVPLALGESLPGTPKVNVDVALGQPDMPYLVVTELLESEEFESANPDGLDHSVCRGLLQVEVYASPKSLARSLRGLVVRALKDADETFDLDNAEAAVLYLRPAARTAPDLPGVAPGEPKAYAAVASFQYILERTYSL